MEIHLVKDLDLKMLLSGCHYGNIQTSCLQSLCHVRLASCSLIVIVQESSTYTSNPTLDKGLDNEHKCFLKTDYF